DPDVCEEHLAEMAGSGHLAQGPDIDAWRAQVDEEVCDTAVFGHVEVGAGEEDPEVGVVRPRCPHLLTVYHPLVAVDFGPGRQTGEVGAGGRLAEQLAPH